MTDLEKDREYEAWFPQRLTQLRMQKGVSARDMSLSIGQNTGYINSIESGKNFPTMKNFFYICEYLRITPQEFFEDGNADPETIRRLVENLKKLDGEQVDALSKIVDGLVR
ncbi:helix-turn-helix domain-containing protein [Gemmiger sp.]